MAERNLRPHQWHVRLRSRHCSLDGLHSAGNARTGSTRAVNSNVTHGRPGKGRNLSRISGRRSATTSTSLPLVAAGSVFFSPRLFSLLAGTAFGSFLSRNTGHVYALASVYFIVTLADGEHGSCSARRLGTVRWMRPVPPARRSHLIRTCRSSPHSL